jgi:hypothetical protein
LVSEVTKPRRLLLSHVPEIDATFLTPLAEIDAAHAERVHAAGCPHCGGALDCADYPRKPRGELGEAADLYSRRRSFCCRREGCRKRATPPSLRFLGRKVYIAVLVVVASAAARARAPDRGAAPGVPARTVRRWIAWWETVFALSAFWTEARGFFATPVAVTALPESLWARFGGDRTAALEKLLRFIAPITTTSVRARIAMVV